jgi:thymidylate synthase
MRNVNLTIDPKFPLLLDRGRATSVGLALVEWATLITGENDLALYKRFSPNFAKFSSDPTNFAGSYGARTAFPLHDSIIPMLRDSPRTRQAYVPITQPYDLIGDSRDLPCVTSYQILLRDRLDMIVNVRSNDLWLGFPYDVFMFAMLQQWIAATLDVGIGWLHWNVGSLHVYDHHVPKIARLTGDRGIKPPPMPKLPVDQFYRFTEMLRTGIPQPVNQYLAAWASLALIERSLKNGEVTANAPADAFQRAVTEMYNG